METRKLGRRPLPPGVARSKHITLWVRPAIEKRIADAAEAHGHTVAEEARQRLETSFQWPVELSNDAEGEGR